MFGNVAKLLIYILPPSLAHEPSFACYESVSFVLNLPLLGL